MAKLIHDWLYQRKIRRYLWQVGAEHPFGLDWDTLQIIVLERHLSLIHKLSSNYEG